MSQKLFIKQILLISKTYLIGIASFAITLQTYPQVSLAQPETPKPPPSPTPEISPSPTPETSPSPTPKTPLVPESETSPSQTTETSPSPTPETPAIPTPETSPSPTPETPSIPGETPPTPREAPSSIPKTPPIPGEAPPETPGEIPPETPGEAPPETPGEAPPETPGEAPPIPGEAPPETPGEAPPIPGEAPPIPGEAPPETPREIPPETPGEIPPETPREIPPETPREIPPETPREIPPATIPREAPPETPREIPPETPREIPPATIPREIPPATIPREVPRGISEPVKPPEPADPEVQRRIRIRPNRLDSPQTEESQTQPARNYIGVGGNLGLSEDEDTGLGESGFTVFSRIGLTNNFSFRPAVTFNDNSVILAPVTFDFPIKSSPAFSKSKTVAIPYIGGGAAISTGDDSSVQALVTGGVDVPLSDKFTANAAVNIGFFDETDVGIRLGVGYRF